ncbi:hypothetical protein BFW01_g11955 [Lasiodiplodia theobromae]|uniref:Vegetative cell wall protein gp1 n=1 Tax=Lasiodiplodia theobromae TaxID=45133 RepID=A0A5N5D2Q5_9PEZI|nr:Vegetative cell wall protein gp1 [Lasiodiplodia theobromae]KAB2571973.1 hypothetical protein DBV05_g9368 [Lasiodiplodia theobromae]KAF4534286.1 Vegetative cell wall protein gp1 [Lasiodiplodia theobromae]KAF9640149.1 hypothetical protein BFW01_g11955 [Lasiodiplodia theobromae]
MYSSAQYSAPPPNYMSYDYMRSPPVSPSPHGPSYYSTRYSSPRGSPKHHSRRASQYDPPTYSYSRPPPPQYAYSYASPRYTSRESTPQRAYDFVSGSRTRPRSRSHYAPEGAPCGKSCDCKYCGCGDRNRSTRSQSYRKVAVDDDYDDYYRESPPPPYEPHQSYPYTTYEKVYTQVPEHKEADATRSRARRASHSSRPTATSTPKRSPPAKAAPKATDEDARRAGIPAGYSFKNWDPTEDPILLLGSVFDANSLGKWIYDWTVFHHGPATPMSEIAGELWLLLIQLAGKVKRAEEAMSKIRKQENSELVEDFLESGERLWVRFSKLLKVCEDYMWKAAKREAGDKKPVSMGKNSGCEFVDTIFGRDRELEKTEKLMTAMRLWSMRFDANCEEILRYPSA